MPSPVLSLRPFTDRDRAFFTGLATDERVTRHIGDGQPWSAAQISPRVTTALEDASVCRVGGRRWFLADDGQQAVGLLTATRRKAGVEIGYWVTPAQWGRGIAGAVITQAQELLPVIFRCSVLLAEVAPDNTASARALVRRGFRLLSRSGGHNCYTWAAGPK